MVDFEALKKLGIIESELCVLRYIKAKILVPDARYKRMVIGAGGRMIKEIGLMSRKEFEVATGNKVYLELTVEEEK